MKSGQREVTLFDGPVGYLEMWWTAKNLFFFFFLSLAKNLKLSSQFCF